MPCAYQNEIGMKEAQQMVDNGITGYIDHGGHRWRPETYVAMDMRSTGRPSSPMPWVSPRAKCRSRRRCGRNI